MSKYEMLQLRKMIADAELVENIIIRLNEPDLIYAQNMESIEKLAQTTEDYELMTSGLWEAYEHEITILSTQSSIFQARESVTLPSMTTWIP